MIDIDEIIHTKETLDAELRHALSTMEKKDTIQKIQKRMMELQNKCPHFSAKYNWTHPDHCPYCGKKY